jgi:hypothetical protein
MAGNGATNLWVTSDTALVPSSGDNIPLMLPPLTDRRQHPVKLITRLLTDPRSIAAKDH